MAHKLTDEQVSSIMQCDDWTESDRQEAQAMWDAIVLCDDCGSTTGCDCDCDDDGDDNEAC